LNKISALVCILVLSANLWASDFQKKADKAIAALPKLHSEYAALEKKYTDQRVKIDMLKEKTKRNFFDIIKIKFALARGDAKARALLTVKKELDDKHDEAFTYAAVALEELTQQFMKAEGKEKENIFKARQKYALFMEASTAILKMEEAADIPMIAGSKDAMQDIKEYREKIKTQAQQRMIIAKEELEVIKEAKEHGIKVDEGYEGMVLKAVKDLKD